MSKKVRQEVSPPGKSPERGRDGTQVEERGDGTWQSWVSLAIVLHAICVGIALAANYSPSPLQSRVLEILGPYVSGLGFHPGGTPFYLTHGDYLDVDWRLEWLPEGEDESDESAWRIALPSSPPFSPRHHREAALLRELGALLAAEDDPEAPQRAALLVQALARDLRIDRDLPAKAIRLRRHTLQPPEAISSTDANDRDPNSSVYFDTVYRADILVDGQRVEIIGRASASEEAATREGAR